LWSNTCSDNPKEAKPKKKIPFCLSGFTSFFSNPFIINQVLKILGNPKSNMNKTEVYDSGDNTQWFHGMG
jgi:hypothetical protein